MTNRRHIVKLLGLAAPAVIIPKYAFAQTSQINGDDDLARIRAAFAMEVAGTQAEVLSRGGTAQSPAGKLTVINDRMANGRFGTGSARARSDASAVIEGSSQSTWIRFHEDGTNYCGPLMSGGEPMTLVEGPNLTVFASVVEYLQTRKSLTVSQCYNVAWPVKSVLRLEQQELVDPSQRLRALITRETVAKKVINGQEYYQDRDVIYAREALVRITYEHENEQPTGSAFVDVVYHGESTAAFEATYRFSF